MAEGEGRTEGPAGITVWISGTVPSVSWALSHLMGSCERDRHVLLLEIRERKLREGAPGKGAVLGCDRISFPTQALWFFLAKGAGAGLAGEQRGCLGGDCV